MGPISYGLRAILKPYVSTVTPTRGAPVVVEILPARRVSGPAPISSFKYLGPSVSTVAPTMGAPVVVEILPAGPVSGLLPISSFKFSMSSTHSSGRRRRVVGSR